jgi:predicted GNAT family acetyltransferase
MDDLSFHFDAARKRYVATQGGEEVAFSEVDPISTDGLLIKHTEVMPAFEGQGIGGKLVRHLLEDARAQGRGVIPACPYAAAWIKRHPETIEYVRESYRAVLAR